MLPIFNGTYLHQDLFSLQDNNLSPSNPFKFYPPIKVSASLKVTRVIQKVENICAYIPHTYFVAADHWFLVFSVMLKSCLIQLYVGHCHVVSAEIVAVIIPYSPDLAPSDFFLFPKITLKFIIKKHYRCLIS